MAASYLRRVARQVADLPRLRPVLSWPQALDPVAERPRAVAAVDRFAAADRSADRTAAPAHLATANALDPVRPATATTPAPILELAPTAEPGAELAAPVATAAEPAHGDPVPPVLDLAMDVVAPPDPTGPRKPGSLPAPMRLAAGSPAGTRSMAHPPPGPVTNRWPEASPAFVAEAETRSPGTPAGDVGPRVAVPRAAPVRATTGRRTAPAIEPADASVAAPDRPRRAGPEPAGSGTVVRVGTIEVVVDRPAVPAAPAPPNAAMAAIDAPASSLTRGYWSTFGLRQG